jgi:hypothetical protein
MLFPGSDRDALPCALDYARALFELGQVNLAEHWAHEALESIGERPEVLQLLARINIVKGCPEAAVPFLGYLRHNPFYRSWADDVLRRLADDPKLESDPQVTAARAVAVRSNVPTGSFPPTVLLLRQLLATNPRNRMAFEYLMGQYLLEGKSSDIAQNISLFDPARPLPRLVAEAVAEFQLRSQKATPELDQRLDKDVQTRLTHFREAISACKDNLDSARLSMAPAFGATYWYFQLFNVTGRMISTAHE